MSAQVQTLPLSKIERKIKNNEGGCPSGTDNAAEEDKKTNKQQGGVLPNKKPQVDPLSGSNTKVGSGKVRKGQEAGFTSSCSS